MKFSNSPWSNYKESDYSLEQWHAACLIHEHDGAPTSKAQCKVPVRTPDGTVNRNGVHAAAAALGGARGGVNAPDSEMEKARRAVRSLYAQMGEEPPDSLKHFGVMGMRWGIRREATTISGRTSSVNDPSPAPTRKRALAKYDYEGSELSSVNMHAYNMMVERAFAPNGSMTKLNSSRKFGAGREKSPHEQRLYDAEVLTRLNKELKKVSTPGFKSEAKWLSDIDAIEVKTVRKPDLSDRAGRLAFNTAYLGAKAVASTAGPLTTALTLPIKHAEELVTSSIWIVERNANKEVIGLQPDKGVKHQTPITSNVEGDELSNFLAHHGVKGQRWGVRRDERALGRGDVALNVHQRQQVKIASAISAVATAGITSNAAATIFQLQSRWEHLKMVEAVMEEAQNNPFINEAGREALRQTRSKIIKGLVSSALATTAISMAVGIISHRTAKAYFAPLHKVYGDAKPKINSDIKKLGKDIKAGKRPSMTNDAYHAEVSKIVQKHMTKDVSNVLQPFHELARSQLGTELGTKKLNVTFSKLPNTNLVEKMTVTTPTGLKLVKAVKVAQHDDLEETAPDLDLYFEYKFDKDGLIEEWSSPTIEIANDIFEGKFDMNSITSRFGGEETPDELMHFGVKGMRWGIRNDQVLGVAPLAARGNVVVTRPPREGGVMAKAADQYQAGVATHNIAKKLVADMDQNKVWGKIEAEITAKGYQPDDIVNSGAIVARHLTETANKYTEAGTSARVMVSHTNNTTMNPQQVPMMHLIVAKNKADVDHYVDLTRENLNRKGPGMDPKKNWIVHEAPIAGLEVLELIPIINERGYISGIQDPDFTEKGEDMAHSINEFLSSQGVTLSHATTPTHDDGLVGPSIQDVIDAMNEDQRETFDIVVGAAVEDEDLSGQPEIVARYNALSAEQKNILDFVVGAILSEGEEIAHSGIDDEDVIAHYGVKGMRWGFRKDDPNAPLSLMPGDTRAGRELARGRVRAGAGTLGDAHLAGLKSTGHRVTNAFLGDKTFWKRTAIIAGVSAATIGAGVATAGLLPAGVLTGIGAHVAGGTAVVAGGKTIGVVGTTAAGKAVVLGPAALAQLGQQTLVGLGAMAGTTAFNIGQTINTVQNTVRAIAGNSQIQKSYARLGSAVNERQTAGNKRINKILHESGSIRKRDITHSFQENVNAVLQHAAPRQRQFDESKVHRDGDGQFAKQTGKSTRIEDQKGKVNGRSARIADREGMPGATDSTKNDKPPKPADDAGKDKGWLNNKNLSSVKDKITVAAMPAIADAQTRVLKKYKLSSMAELKDNDDARTELATSVRDIFQKQADKIGASSPSGDHKIVYKIGAKGNVYAQAVDKKGAPAKDFSDMEPVEHTRVRELAKQIRESGWRPPTFKSSGGSSSGSSNSGGSSSGSTTKPNTSGTSTTQTPGTKPGTNQATTSTSTSKTKKDPHRFRNDEALATRESRSDDELEDEIADSLTDLMDLFKSPLKHSDDQIDNFLAHHGIKGMRWGVRRTDAQLGNPDGGKNGVKSRSGIDVIKSKFRRKGAGDSESSDTARERDAEKAKNPFGGTDHQNSSGSGVNGKAKADDDDSFISADAERFVKTRMKDGHEMSDQEIKKALERARMVQQYDEMFNGGPNAELKAKVEALKLQKEAAEYKAAMTPSKLDKVNKFLKVAENGFEAYQKLDKATGGALNANIGKGLGSIKATMAANAAKSAPVSSPLSSSGAKGSKTKVRVSDFLREVKTQQQGGKHKMGVPTTPGYTAPRPKKPSPVFKITDLGDPPKRSDYDNPYSFSKALDVYAAKKKFGTGSNVWGNGGDRGI